MSENRVTGLGFFQNPRTAEKVLSRLQKKGLKRSIGIQRDHYGAIKILKTEIFRSQFFAAFAAIIIFSLLAIFHPIAYSVITSIFLATLLGILIWGIYNYYHYHLDPKLVKKYTSLVVSDETLVMVQVSPKDVSSVLTIFRHVESGHPVFFLIRPTSDRALDRLNIPNLIKEPLTTEQMGEHAKELASLLKDVGYTNRFNTSPLKNLKRSEESLKRILNVLGEAELVEQTVTILQSGYWTMLM